MEICYLKTAMFKITISLALLILCLATHAQVWQPFAVNESHHFRADTGTWIDRTIHVDSVTQDTNGTVWHFPRLLQVLDPQHAIGNVPHFCQRTLRLQGNGRYQFFNPGNIFLDAHTGLGGLALVDSLGTATGLVTRIYEGSILGEVDSIKVIALTTGDSLVLSKTHGLVEWPASLGPQRYRLAGLQSRHLGDTLPGFDGFFQYKAGNVYCWNSGGTMYDNTRPVSQQPPPEHNQFKVKILAAMRDSTGLNLEVKVIIKKEGFEPIIDTAAFHIPDLPRGLHRVGPGEMVAIGEPLRPYFFPSASAVWNPFSVDLRGATHQLYAAAKYVHRNDTTILTFEPTDRYQFWYNPWGTLGQDSLSYYYLGEEKMEIAQGLGFRSSKSRAVYQTITYTWSIYMTGYVIDGDTVGAVWPDEETPPSSVIPDWTLWPIPANTMIHFTSGNNEGGTIQIIDMTGRTVRAHTYLDKNADLPIEDLRPGIYTFRFLHGDTFVDRRFVVVR
jgi:hypothetical protein